MDLTRLRLLDIENRKLGIDFGNLMHLLSPDEFHEGRWLIYRDEYENYKGHLENFLKIVRDDGRPFVYHISEKEKIRKFFERTRKSYDFTVDRDDIVEPFDIKDYKMLYDFLKANKFILNRKKGKLIDATEHKLI